MKEDEIDTLSRLCYITFSKEERSFFSLHLKRVISYIDQLKEVDTEGVAPCFSVAEAASVTREDTAEDPFPTSLFLENVPAHTGGFVRVPPVL